MTQIIDSPGRALSPGMISVKVSGRGRAYAGRVMGHLETQISNVAALKVFRVGGLVFDGGALIFPISYIFGDVMRRVRCFDTASQTPSFCSSSEDG